jgi:hypothetical protein
VGSCFEISSCFRKEGWLDLEPIETQLTTASPALTPEIAEVLRAEAFSALKSLPRRGAEIGGFLTVSPGGANEVCADGIELVPSEYRYGPSYRLSPSDLELLRRKAEIARVSDRKKVVGYFRSCTRAGFGVEEDDLTAIREAIPGTPFIFLAKSFQSGDAIVRVFPSDRDAQHGHVAEFEVHIDLASRAGAARDPAESKPTRGETGEAGRIDSRFPFHQTFMATPTPVRVNRIVWARNSGLAAFVIAGLTWAYLDSHAVAPATDLGMRVETQADSLRLTWNRNSPVVRSANAGSLRIDDGHEPHELKLNQSQMATGSFVYVPNSNDVTFRLQVEGRKGPELTESVRILKGNQPPAPEPPKAPEVQTAAIAPAPVAPPPHKKRPRTARRVKASGDESEQVLPVMRAWPSASPGDRAYRPAQPLRRIAPEVQASLLNKSAVVEVEVRIDDRGRVIGARQVGADPKSGSQLPASAIAASRQWIFEPAKNRGQSVESDYKIVYRFSPPGN